VKLIKIHALQFGNVYGALKNYSSNNVILILVYICKARSVYKKT